MHSGEDKSIMVKLPEGMIPSVQTTQNEVLGRKYTGEEVTFDDSGDEEYFPVIYGSGGGNEHAKISNDAESGSADQKNIPQGKGKSSIHDQVKDGDFASKDAREDVTNYEAIRNKATSKLNSIYEEILPVVEAHGLDNQDGVPFSVVEKWTEAQCSKYKADFDLYFSMIKNVIMCPRPATDATAGSQTGNAEEGAGPQTGTAEGAGSQTGDAEEGAGSQTGTAE